MQIVKALEVQEAPNPHDVSVRALYASEHVQTMMVTLQPGEALRRHITPVDVFFYVLDGEATIEIGDERETVDADTLVESPADIVHRVLNESDAPCRFLVVKTPKPTQSSRML